MRNSASAFLAICLLLGLPFVAIAADKIKVEIVETTNTVLLVPHTFPGTPEQVNTHCRAAVNGNTATGDCSTTVTPASDATTGLMPTPLFSAKAILPDGSHAALACFPWNKNCAAIAPIAAERSSPDCTTAGSATLCTTKNLGTYQAKRDKNELLIFTPNGKLKYRITGSW